MSTTLTRKIYSLFYMVPKEPLICLLMLICAFVLSGVFPYLSWGIGMSIVIWCLGDALKHYCDKRDCYRLLGIALFSMLIPLISLAIWGYADLFSERSDALDYYTKSSAIADSWRSGVFPHIESKGSSPYLGTLHTGYHRVLASAFMMFGVSPIVGIVVNVLSLPIIILCVYLITIILLTENDATKTQRHSLPLIAAIVVACHPAYAYWTRFILKDISLCVVYLVCLTTLLYCIKTKKMMPIVATGFVGYFLFSYRIYALFSLLAGVFLYMICHLKKQTFVIASICLCCVAALFMYSLRVDKLVSQAIDSAAAVIPNVAPTAMTGFVWIGQSVPRYFLAPYGWIKAAVTVPTYGQYPGMWYLYLAYPFCIAGVYQAMKKNCRLWILLIAPILLNLLIIAIAFQGDANRQRLYLESVILIMAVLGFQEKTKWRFAVVIWSLIFVFAVSQTVMFYYV